MIGPRFERVAIVGVGLIGGSLALDCRAAALWGSVVGIGRTRANLDLALARQLIDEASQEVAAAAGAELVILATPVGSLVAVAAALAPHLRPGCLVTDVGSVKGGIVEAVAALLPEGVDFVGSHPIAGSEQQGAGAAREGLFRGAPCVVCPPAGARPAAVERTRALWAAVGARVEVMEPLRHDRILAAISHLPHLVAYALAGAALEVEGEACGRLAGSGLHDTTRIARSSPELWRDICLLNRDALLVALDRFEARLAAMRAAVSRGDGDALAAQLAAARAALEAIDG